MSTLRRRVKAIEANHANKPMSKADEEIIRARLLAKLQLIGAGRELPACCKRRPDDREGDPKLVESKNRLLARLERMAEDEPNQEPKAEFTPLPDDELDRLERFLIETEKS